MRKKNKDLLVDRLVMLDPHIVVNNTDHKKLIAKVADADPAKGRVNLQFNDGSYGEYGEHMALTLYPKAALLHVLHVEGKSLNLDDYRQVTEVVKAALAGDHEQALILAAENQITFDLCLVNCSDFREMKNRLGESKRQRLK